MRKTFGGSKSMLLPSRIEVVDVCRLALASRPNGSSISMQTPFMNHQAGELSDQAVETVSRLVDTAVEESSSEQAVDLQTNPPFLFRGDYVGQMEMSAERHTVACYLDNHKDWFLRCAHPMTADPLGKNGYALTIGHFGALGYDVEPKIGLHLLPQDEGIYRIETLPVPGYVSQGYDVDFKASLELNDCSSSADGVHLTQVEWELSLWVWVHFPRFINALPKRIIQKTGDHLLSKIVRQVSRCLTLKVQEDFHQTLDLSLPDSCRKRKHHFFERFSKRSEK